MTTRVISMHQAPHQWELDPRFTYIGRAGHGQDGYFGNPFYLTNERDRPIILAQYREWFWRRVERDEIFRSRVSNLKGQTLVCFCAPKQCHGDVIANYAERYGWDPK